MKNSLLYTFLILIILTILSASLSHFQLAKTGVIVIVIFAIIKFLLVGFQFLELQLAHKFWKVLFVIYSCLMAAVFIILL
ncbi:MAG: cytochrome C oxidase subunit IV family protein [Chitinophagales bacterium]|nr:cytochrome C oxidase subunit IV family protein [Chitinophagales bacterium]